MTIPALSDVLIGDIGRVVSLVLAGGAFMLAAYVVVLYARQYRVQRKAVREGSADTWRGMLPRHVATIGLSYLLLVTATLVETYMRIHEAPTWRMPLYCAAYLLGMWALWDVLGHVRYRTRDLGTRLDKP